MNVDLKIIDDRLGAEFPLPDYAKEGDAGIDLRAMIDEPITINAGQMMFVPTGIAISMNNSDIVGIILPRSGLGSRGLILGNSTGVIDSGYTGEIKLTPYNRNLPKYKYDWQSKRIYPKNSHDTSITINPGDRIAQLIFTPIHRVKFNIVEELGETSRGDKGFNSTGVNELTYSDKEDNDE